MLKTIINSLPLLKYCYGKNRIVTSLHCDCINKCRMIYLIHKKELIYQSPIICSMTDTFKKIGDCNCKYNCSAIQNDLHLYDLTNKADNDTFNLPGC